MNRGEIAPGRRSYFYYMHLFKVWCKFATEQIIRTLFIHLDFDPYVIICVKIMHEKEGNNNDSKGTSE